LAYLSPISEQDSTLRTWDTDSYKEEAAGSNPASPT
jgi:hypothetical protein